MAASMYGIGGLGASGAMKDGGRKAGRSPSPQSVARHGKGGGPAPPLPGPIDATELSISDGLACRRRRPLVVRPGLAVGDGCTAVPERFYKLIRSVHGVLCDGGGDGSKGSDAERSVAFRGGDRVEGYDPAVVIHHHVFSYQGDDRGGPPRPIEFRRKILPSSAVEVDTGPVEMGAVAGRCFVETYPVRIDYSVVAEGAGGGGGPPLLGAFFFFPVGCPPPPALLAVLRSALSSHSAATKRIWYPASARRATRTGDGYDLVDLEGLVSPSKAAELGPDEKAQQDARGSPGLLRRDTPTASAAMTLMTLGKWIRECTGAPSPKESPPSEKCLAIHLLLETKSGPTAAWPREALELVARLQPGDFVDASDNSGSWYEAQVHEVLEDRVKVHFFGWASRWDGWICRRRPGEGAGTPDGCMPNASSPAPLHSRSRKWREFIVPEEEVEVREVGSRPDRPRWFRGVVKNVAPDGIVMPTGGGAELETFEAKFTGDGAGSEPTKRPLLLLQRKNQVLVEVSQERLNWTGSLPISSDFPNAADASDIPLSEPPYLRWIYVYGEEICRLGTHIEVLHGDQGNKPATVTYAHPPSKAPVTVMKSFNDVHGQGFIRESIRGVPPASGCVGLQNLGNSCFMNSILQILNQVDFLTKFFINGDWKDDLNMTNPLGSGGLVASAYASFLSDLWSSKYCVLAPRTLRKCIGAFAPQFNNLHQHDSQEFCNLLMDGIHEDLNRVLKKPYVENLEAKGLPEMEAAVETWRKHLMRHDSIIVDHCQGLYRSHVTCPKCGHESVTYDVYSTVTIPLASSKGGKPVPLMDCLERLTMGEQLDEDNTWYCSGCKTHVCALKMIALWSCPDMLILQIKRFKYKHCNANKGVVRTKVNDIVAFPVETLDLSDQMLGPVDEDAPPIYELFGVSEHVGETANSGHYTASVRNKENHRQWYKFNDSHVGYTTPDATVTGGAYLLFYQRKKGRSRWGGMEKTMNNLGVNPHGANETDVDGFTQVKPKNRKSKMVRKES